MQAIATTTDTATHPRSGSVASRKSGYEYSSTTYVSTRRSISASSPTRASSSTRSCSAADLAALPFTEKSELRESQITTPPLGEHAAASLRDVVRIHASSGTTGRPSYVGVTAQDADVWAEVAARVYRCRGVTEDDVVVHGLALGFFVGGLPLAEGVQRTGATFVPVGIGATDRLVQSALDLARPSSHAHRGCRYLIDYMRNRMGQDPRTLGFRRILVAPNLADPSRRSARRSSQPSARRSTRVLAMPTSFPCTRPCARGSDGNHLLAEDHILFELHRHRKPGRNGIGVDGAEGELVTTHLDRQCVPRFGSHSRPRSRSDRDVCLRPQSPRITCIGRTRRPSHRQRRKRLAVSDQRVSVLDVAPHHGSLGDFTARRGPRTQPPIQLRLARRCQTIWNAPRRLTWSASCVIG